MDEWPEMQEWMNEFIKSYNLEIKERGIENVRVLINLQEPIQLHVVSFLNPSYGYVVVTHFPEEGNICNVYGPFESKNAEKVLEDFTKIPFWDREFDDRSFPKIHNIRGIIESFVIRCQPGSNFMNDIWNSSTPRFSGNMGFPISGIFYAYFGELITTDPKEVIKNVIIDIKPVKNTTTQKIIIPTPKEQEPKKGFVKACFSAFYPPLEIGEITYTFSEKYKLERNRILFDKEYPCYCYQSHGKNLWFLQNGQIIVEVDNRKHACKIINHILASGVLKQIFLFKAQIKEIGEGEFNPTTGRFGSSQGSITSLRTLQTSPFPFLKQKISTYGRFKINKKKLDELMAFANSIENNHNFLQQRYFEAYTHFHNEEYDSAFVISYIIIEYWLTHLWEDSLKVLNDETRTKYLTNTKTGYWSTDRTIEILNLFLPTVIDQDGYQLLKKLKSRRNSLVHQGTKVTKEDAEKCLDLAYNLLIMLMGIKTPDKIEVKDADLD